jgi:RNA-directed DNA polymerase
MYTKLSPYLEKRGLELAKEKTRVTHITEGFDFLGFTCRQFKTNGGMKLLIKPSKGSVKKAREKIKKVFTQLRGHSVRDLIMKLNPIIRGIGNYWSSQVAKKIFTKIDFYVWIKVRKHLKVLHPNKSFKWIYKKYFKPDYTGASKSKWILTDPNENKIQLFSMSWIPIVRHAMITFKNSPDDAKLKEYFEERDRKEFGRDNVLSRRKLAKCSKYKCRVCKQSLAGNESLKINQIVPKNLGGDERYSNLELLHECCLEQHTKLLLEYGGGRDLPKIHNFFKNRQVESNSPEGYRLMKDAFRKFKYQYV